MNLNYKILIGVLVLLLILGALNMFGFNNKKTQQTGNNSQIIETKTFSCPGMDGFTFEYPVFEGWEIRDIQGSVDKAFRIQAECTISLNTKRLPSTEQGKFAAPDIKIMVKTDDDFLSGFRRNQSVSRTKMEILSNPAGIDYYGVKYLEYPLVIQENKNPDEIIFQIAMAKVVSIAVPDYTRLGFNREQFFKTVIESFRLTKKASKQYILKKGELVATDNFKIIWVDSKTFPAQTFPNGVTTFPENTYLLDVYYPTKTTPNRIELGGKSQIVYPDETILKLVQEKNDSITIEVIPPDTLSPSPN